MRTNFMLDFRACVSLLPYSSDTDIVDHKTTTGDKGHDKDEKFISMNKNNVQVTYIYNDVICLLLLVVLVLVLVLSTYSYSNSMP
jgi:hypothetical protein